MAFTLTSYTEPVAEMQAAVEAHNMKAVVADTKAVETPATAQPATPAQPDKPAEGVTPAAATGGETDLASEAGTAKPPTQEIKDPNPAADGMTRGKFKAKIVKAEERIARLSDDLEIERGDKSKLRKQLDEAQAELAKLKAPAEITKEAVGPVKPKRPKLEDFEFDQEKLDAALDKYDEDLAGYHSAMAEKKVDERLAQAETQRQEKAREDETARLRADFNKRMTDGRVPELNELLDQIEDDVSLPPVVEDYIFGSENPAHIMAYFAKEAVAGDSAELNRIASLSPLQQVRQLTLLEERLVREREETKASKPETPAKPASTPAAAAPAAPEVPVKPKPVAKAPMEPIEPVGSRAGSSTASLANAAGSKEYFKLRASGVNR